MFLCVKNTPLSPLHLFPDLMDLNLRHLVLKCFKYYDIINTRLILGFERTKKTTSVYTYHRDIIRELLNQTKARQKNKKIVFVFNECISDKEHDRFILLGPDCYTPKTQQKQKTPKAEMLLRLITYVRRFELPTPWSVAKCSIQLSYTYTSGSFSESAFNAGDRNRTGTGD